MLQFINCRDMKVSVSSHGEQTRIVVEVLGDDVGLEADHTSARFRVTVSGQSAEIVATALVP